jgi:hypothetical protein
LSDASKNAAKERKATDGKKELYQHGMKTNKKYKKMYNFVYKNIMLYNIGTGCRGMM